MIKILSGACIVLTLLCIGQFIAIRGLQKQKAKIVKEKMNLELRIEYAGKIAENLDDRRLFEDSLKKVKSQIHEEKIKALRNASADDIRRLIEVSITDTSRQYMFQH